MALRERILGKVADLACRRANLVLMVAVLLTLGSFAVIYTRGRVSTDLADIMPRDGREAALFIEAAERFASDVLILSIEADDPADVTASTPFVDRLAARLLGMDRYVKSVEYRIGEAEREFVRELAEERGFLYLSADDISRIDEKISTEAIHKQMTVNRERLEAAGLEYFRNRIVPDPLDLLEVFQLKQTQSVGQFTPREGEDYIISPDGRMLLMLLQATESLKDLTFSGELVRAVKGAEKATWAELVEEDPETWQPLHERVRVIQGGGYAVAVNENRVLQEDLNATFLLSLAGVMLLFVIAFKRVGALFYIGTPLVASVVWTLAVALLAFEHISLMSGGFAAILVGLSVDYAIHIYNRYVAERTRGMPLEAAVREAILKSGSGIFFGALTTAVAFFGVTMTSFVGLAEFGFLAGVGVLLGMLAMLFVQPAMLVFRNKLSEEPLHLSRFIGFGLDGLANGLDRRPWWTFWFSIVVAAGAAAYVYGGMTIHFFDSDFRNLRAESEVFDLHDRIQRKFSTNLGGMVAISRGATPEEAVSKAAVLAERSNELMDGIEVARTEWSDDETSAGFRPWVAVKGAPVRLRRAEITLPGDAPVPENLAYGVETLVRADGRRVLVYDFSSSAQMADWTVRGESYFRSGIDMAPSSVAEWRHTVGGPFEATFSLWWLSPSVEMVTLGADSERAVELPVDSTRAFGSQWPLVEDDQLRLTMTVEPGEGIAVRAGRGTVVGLDSIVSIIPPIEAQRLSARYVASIDSARIERDIADAALAVNISPRAFGGFVRDLRAMVERARAVADEAGGSPGYVTVDGMRESRLGGLLSKYVAVDEAAPPEARHIIATYIFPERSEMPRGWFTRVRNTIGRDVADISSPRLVGLEIRDIVHEDFSWITAFVFAGVMLSLLWSFGSIRWAILALLPVAFAFSALLAALMLIGHQLNLINVLIFPVILGIGIDNGIHVIHRFRESGRVHDIVKETGRALVLTSLTTMIGFGSLMVSRYPGLGSLGFVATIGMFFALFGSLVALPALLSAISRIQNRARSEGEDS